MATAEIIMGESGGGNEDLYIACFSVTGNQPLDTNGYVTINGTPKKVYTIDEDGYCYTNVNQTTNEVLTNSCYANTTAYSMSTMHEDSSIYFILSNGRIQTNAKLRSSNKMTFILYTIE